MSPEKIGLIVEMQDDDFKKGVKDYEAGVDKMEKSNKDLAEAADKSGKSIDRLGDEMEKGGLKSLELAAQMAIVAEGMQIVKELAGKGLELAKLGATAKRIEDRFAAFSEEVGGSEAALDAFQEGAGGAASEMEAMQSASQLLQMDLVNSTDEMARTVEIATRLGDQTQSVTERTENYALMLANQSLPRLDSYGISSGIVRKRIIEMMEATEGLTREEAFKLAVEEEAAKALAILGERTEDTAMTFEIMEARMADARVELGKKLAPAFGEAFKALGSLGDEVLMVASAFGEFGGALVQAGPLLNAMLPALKKMPAALKAMNLGLNRSTLAMGGLLVAIPVLIKVTGDLVEKNKEVDRVAKEAVKTAEKWELGIAAQISQGREAADVFAQYGQKAQTASDAWNANIVTGTALGGIFGTHNKILKVFNQTQKEVIASSVTWGGTYEETIKYIDIYNSNITDSSLLISGFTEEMYNNIVAFREWVGPAEALNIAVWDLTEALLDGELALYGFEDTSADVAQQMEYTTRAWEVGRDAIFRYETETEEMNRLARESKDALAAKEQAVKDAEEADRKATEELDKLAAAHDRAKEAAFRHAEGLLGLAERLSNAEDSEVLFRAGIEKLAQMQTDKLIDGDQYLTMVANLQEQFGFTTEKGVFLKDGIELLGDALAKDKIKPQDYGDALEHLDAMAARGVTDVGLFKDVIEEYESPAEAAARRTEEMTQAIENQEVPIGRGFAAMDRLKNVYTDSEEPMLNSTEAVDDFTGKVTDADKPTEDLTGKVDDLTTASDETVEPFGDATEAVDDFAEAVLNTQEPVDELLARFQLLPQEILLLVPEMKEAGIALVGAFRVGFEGAFDALEKEKIERLRLFREEFHMSREPKDPTSPLRGFYEAGQALVQTYMEGLESMFPELGNTLDKLFAFGSTAGGLGGAAAAILNKSARALKEQTKGIDARLIALYKSIGGKGTPRGAEAINQAIVAALGGYDKLIALQMKEAKGEVLTFEEERILGNFRSIQPLMRERNEMQKEYVRLQEKLLRLEEAQTRLRFLEQQVTLLKLITEYKLDAADILKGMPLGAEAAAEDVLDAMMRVMEEVIRQAEERLEIASPSGVFRRIGQQTMQGMAMGIQDLATLPVRQSMIMSSAVASAPAMAGRDYNVTNSRRVTVNSGGNVFNTGMDETAFSARTTRDVSRAMRGR